MSLPLPQLQTYLKKTVRISLNNENYICGILVGFDEFPNLTIRDAIMSSKADPTNETHIGVTVIRGNAITFIEVLS
eukprot:TRINITY_DN2107_c0_g1_i1.p1 TRINITY_DN2107_c0_g1~~TRINITY_DN2107_c0_g1_i1.p1  ORF type:complete len:86 (-),score=24.44 TRINITY_DN2107_c0_g1_i1:73-300(-)